MSSKITDSVQDKNRLKMSKKNTPLSSILFIAIIGIVFLNLDYIYGFIFVLLYISVEILLIGKLPLMKEMHLLFLIILIGIISSLINFGTLNEINIFRDLIYFFKTLLLIYFGYYIGWKNKDDIDYTKFIFSIFVVYSFLVIFCNFLNILLNLNFIIHDFSFLKIRENMGASDELWVIGFFILYIYPRYYGVRLFTNKVEKIFYLFFGMAFFLTFSRTSLINLCICLFTYALFNRKIKVKHILFAPLMIIFISVSIYFLFKLEFMHPFISKIENSLAELSIKTDWNRYENIVHNWRGYEVFVALNQFNNFSLLQKIIGSGFGTLVPVKYTNLVGVPLGSGGIILLHNGYYTLLVKTGIFGLLCYLMFFCKLIFLSIKKYFDNAMTSIVLLVISIITLISTYTTTGIFKRSYSFVTLIFIGFLIFTLSRKRKDSLEG
ncbi:TPA: O-antigen ligase family protein [Enterococcus faecium]|uniref:O-antigen ligase family protein n=1 Tax=Enterococcus TaxID=1350 RepID=UPI00064CB010|nr:O-antigen ligase family protein [Enterococcus faecium]